MHSVRNDQASESFAISVNYTGIGAGQQPFSRLSANSR
jgi:hypothetical protein